MLESVCIVIPIYKPFTQLKLIELLAWKQCLQILGHRRIYLINPSRLDINGYQQSLDFAKVDYDNIDFDSSYFADIFGYNRLMFSQEFYKKFLAYEYMLIYQLDAYIFEDRLSEWCNKGYSYVGAPWFKGFVPSMQEAELWNVGNGGFSLRRIPDFLKVLNSFSIVRSWDNIFQDFIRQSKPVTFRNIIWLGKRLLLGNNTYWRFNDYDQYAPQKQEDYFWGIECPRIFNWFKVPSAQEALSFSFEVHPSKMYFLNGNNLPMGCHAWDKYDIEFWGRFIKMDSV